MLPRHGRDTRRVPLDPNLSPEDPLEGLKLTVVTPVADDSLDWLPAAEDSVSELNRTLQQRGADVDWRLCLDGADLETDPQVATAVVRWARQRGVSAARNAALTSAEGEWVFPLDADDLLNPHGVAAALSVASLLRWRLSWLGLNRTLVDGERTPHWFGACQEFQAGALAQSWTSPFPFHPNSILSTREGIWLAGGWPATAVNEDLGLALSVSEEGAGMMYPAVATRYRVRPGQQVGHVNYADDKKVAFEIIERLLDTRRIHHGRPRVRAPIAGYAFGRERTTEAADGYPLNGVTVGVSLDSVIRDYVTGFRWWLRKEDDSPLSPGADVPKWDTKDCDLVETHTRAVESGLNTWLPPVPDAVSGVGALQLAGARVVAYNSLDLPQGCNPFKDLAKWMAAFDVHFDDVRSTGDTDRGGIDLFIEGSPTETERLRSAGNRVMIFDKPGNHDVHGPRLMSWNRSLEAIRLALGAL